MTTLSSVVVNTSATSVIKDDFFLCRAFAQAISCDKLVEVIEQQSKTTASVEQNMSTNDNIQLVDASPSGSDSIKWNVNDQCLCPYTEDGLLYKATIIDISSSSCTVSFDDYGNEEIHPLSALQIRSEEQPESLPPIDENDILPPPPPPPPPFPLLDASSDNETLSATLMSWYLAGYHTGFYQAMTKQNK